MQDLNNYAQLFDEWFIVYAIKREFFQGICRGCNLFTAAGTYI